MENLRVHDNAKRGNPLFEVDSLFQILPETDCQGCIPTLTIIKEFDVVKNIGFCLFSTLIAIQMRACQGICVTDRG